MKITAEKFEQAVGRPPEQDDLERCNCPHAGRVGHWQCGWDTKANLPVFATGNRIMPGNEGQVKVTPGGTVEVDPVKAVQYAQRPRRPR